MIKLYTYGEYLTPNYRAYVFPLLFDLIYLKRDALDPYYALVDDLDNCDIAVFPIDITHLFALRRKNELFEFIKAARKSRKKIWVYSGGDIGNTIAYNDIYVFRLGGFDSKLGKRTLILPSFIDDPLERVLQRDFTAIQKSEKPDIGFVGHAQAGVKKYLEEVSSFIRWNLRRYRRSAFSDFQSFYPSGVVRARQLNKLKADTRLKCNFVFRSKYRAGVTTEEERKRTTGEFYENIFDNMYTFCIRGHGNFSVRFYETIAMGRIPILVDTDCRMPLQQVIEWKEHAIIVSEEDIGKLADAICQFHDTHSEAQLIQKQINNRQLWHEKLSRVAYFKTIHQIFANKNQ